MKKIKMTQKGWYISTNEKGLFDHIRLVRELSTSKFRYEKILYAKTREKLIQKINTTYPKYKWQ